MKKIFYLTLHFLFILSACQPNAINPAPTFTATKEVSKTPELTSTPGPTPTPFIPKPEVIIKDNIKNLEVIANINNVFLANSRDERGKILFSTDDSKVYFIQLDNKISVFETDEWMQVDEKTSTDIRFTSLVSSLSPNQTWLSTGSAYLRGYNLYDYHSLEKKYDFDLLSDRHSYQFSPDEKYFVAGGEDASIFMWNLEDGRRINVEMNHDYSGSDWNGWTGPVWVLKFSKDGSFLASGGNDQTVRLWRIPSGENFGVLYGHKMAVQGLEISDTGRYIASYGEENSFRLWDLETQTTAGICEGHKPITKTGYSGNDYYLTGLKQVKISSDERYIVSQGKDETIRVWSIPDCSLLYTIENEELYFISEDGSFFASIKDNVAMFRETENRNLLFSIPDTSILALSNDGKYIVAGLSDFSVQVWTAMQQGATPSNENQPLSDKSFKSPTEQNTPILFCDELNIFDPKDYPLNAYNFQFDQSTTQDQIEALKNCENSFYDEILSLYFDEVLPYDYESEKIFEYYEPNIQVFTSGDGCIKNWTLVLKDISNGNFYLPALSKTGEPRGGVPYPNLNIDHKTPKVQLNSFLVPANNTYGLKIIFDKSGWPIIVTGDYSKWYSINSKQYGWIDITEDEKKHLGLIKAKTDKVVISTDPYNPDTWPRISFDELPKYREDLKKYVEKNQVFSDDVFQNMGQYLLNRANEYYTRIIFSYHHFLIHVYRDFPNRIPRKTFAFGILEWQIPGTKVERSILLSQLWLDEENEPSIILNYFIPCQTSDCTEKFVDYYPYIESGFYEPMPSYFSANDESDGYIFSDLDEVEQALVRQKNSEIFKVGDLFNKWIEEQKIPKELESKLLYTNIWTIVE